MKKTAVIAAGLLSLGCLGVFEMPSVDVRSWIHASPLDKCAFSC
jgi:hypothetical protein